VQPVVGATPTQYALGICFLFLGPAFGLAGGFLQWRRGLSVFAGMFAATGVSWMAWIGSCVLALFLFPEYPRHPSEPVAMLFTLPGLVSGALVLRWTAKRRAPERGPRWLGPALGTGLIAAVAALSVAAISVHVRALEWPAYRELPDGATVIFERAYEDSFFGEYMYEMDARMTHDEFCAWMRRLGLRPRTPEERIFERGSMEGLRGCGSRGEYEGGVARFRSNCR
jgi:hypothetical protein